MKRVTGLGGLFFKSENPERLYDWYEQHLGVARGGEGAVSFNWRETENPKRAGMTVWCIFPADTKYFGTGRSNFMMNFRVADLDGLLAKLREAGVEVDPHQEDYDYGRFAWITDPDGNRVELWEPGTPKKTAAKKKSSRAKKKKSSRAPQKKHKRAKRS